jgi:lipopolysaccharide transport system ATP-binding protein
MDQVYKSYADRVPGIKAALVGPKLGQIGKLKDQWVLKGLSFTVKKGISLGIVGPNGAGKTTILRLIHGTTVHNKGSITLNGSASTIVELGGGFHPDLSGVENLRISAGFMGYSPNYVDENITKMVEFSELGKAATWPVRAYSSGMVARLAFSVLTAVQSDLMCIDEVLAVGDSYFQDKSLHFLDSLKRKGITFVVISHAPDVLRQVVDQVLILRDGQVDQIGPTDEILDLYAEQMRHSE